MSLSAAVLAERQPDHHDAPASCANRQSKTRRDAGFTLIELLVCLVLLAGLATIALPRLTAERPPTLADWAEDVALDLARLRQEAMGSGTVRIANSDALAATLTPDIHLQSAEPPTIVFLPNGMSNGAIWRLESGGKAMKLAVDWLTGRITVDAI